MIQGASTDPGVVRARELGDQGLYDLIFIDGDHTYEGVKADFAAFSALLRPSGIIGFHDIVDSTT